MDGVKRRGRFVTVGAMRLEVPESVAHLCDGAGQLRAIHGLEETDTCVCGELCTMSAHGQCPECGRPYQRKCVSCDSWGVAGDMVGGRWYDPPAQCDACERERADKARRALLGGIPADTRDAAVAYRKRLDHRALSDSVLGGWLQDDCGKVRGGSLCVWLSGPHGCGKSVSVARAATHAVSNGMVKSFLWTTSREILEASKMRFIEGGGAYRALIDRARDVELLVLDEMWRNGRGPMGKLFGVEGATQNALMVLADIIRSRIDHRQPILFTSKHKADSIMQLLGDSTWYRIRNDIYSAVMGPVDMRDE